CASSSSAIPAPARARTRGRCRCSTGSRIWTWTRSSGSPERSPCRARRKRCTIRSMRFSRRTCAGWWKAATASWSNAPPAAAPSSCSSIQDWLPALPITAGDPGSRTSTPRPSSRIRCSMRCRRGSRRITRARTTGRTVRTAGCSSCMLAARPSTRRCRQQSPH
ncbi:MAG: hypothetical protein AVDCRST_MAG71-2716, partial [uncultured Lysobacter sp.]